MKPVIALLVVIALRVVPFGLDRAAAGEPTDQIRTHIEAMFRITGGSRSQSASQRDQAIRKVADQMFDWEEMAKESLAKYWVERRPADRAEFVRLFADLFARVYLSKIQLADAKGFTYLSEAQEDARAQVRTKVITTRGNQISVDYRVRLADGQRWRVYDLDVEGISLVGNYRAQFDAIIRRSSYEELVNRLKARDRRSSEAAGGTQGFGPA